MIRSKNLAFPLLFSSFLFFSCSDDDSSSTPDYSVPATYSFEREGATTIDFSGQTARLMMLDEMGTYIRVQATNNASVDAGKLASMYSNSNNEFSGSGLNSSGKQLRDKTASSLDYFSLNFGGGSIAEQISVRALFESMFADAALASSGSLASAGVAGSYLDGNSVRLFAANGLEPQQVFLKGMMGASLLDQLVNNYLSVHKLDAGQNREFNTDKVLESGKNYTAMEHFWDEAYGYVYGADVTSPTPSLKFWSSYISQVNADSDFNTLSGDIDLAFRKGRAAIVANDYETRDQQIDIIKSKLATACAVRAVFYLQEGKAKLGIDNGAKAFHALSEGYGFIMSLRYTNKPGTDNPYFTKSEVDAMLNQLMSGTDGLWNVSPQILDTLSAQIASRFDFTVEQASVVN